MPNSKGALFHQGEFWIPEVGQTFTKEELFGPEYHKGTIFWTNTVADYNAISRHEQKYDTKSKIMKNCTPHPNVCLQLDEYIPDQQFLRNKTILDGSTQPMDTFRIQYYIQTDLILTETYTVSRMKTEADDYEFQLPSDRPFYLCCYEIRDSTNRLHRNGDRPAVGYFTEEDGLITEKFYQNGLPHRDKGPAHVFVASGGSDSWGVEFYDKSRQHNQWGPQSLYFKEQGMSCVHELLAMKFKMNNVRTIFKGVDFGNSEFVDCEMFLRYLADTDTPLNTISNGNVPEELQFDFQMRFGFDIKEEVFMRSLRKADAEKYEAYNDTAVKNAIQTLKDLL